MTTSKPTIAIATACVGLAALLTYAGAAQPLKVDFSDETIGGEPHGGDCDRRIALAGFHV